MTIRPAVLDDIKEILAFDRHIALQRLENCVQSGQVFVLSDGTVRGVLRWSLFWQSIPFLDLIYLDDEYRGKGHGRAMMSHWEEEMRSQGFPHVMLSTQADETARYFYEKLGYCPIGSFLPPEQEAQELIYLKKLSK